ncbi:MAG TPA: hypothetical protein VMJ35_00830 [Dongiaceae bacterium]|nr:hypothetical protein [Dongiaceae bacterium]
MKRFGLFAVAVASLFFPSLSKAQTTGRVECARTDDYIYLYSSPVTLDVRKTLQCGEIIEITGTYDAYYAARTAKGLTGYVPKAMVVILKDQPGTGLPQAAAPERERTPYDEKQKRVMLTAPQVSGFVLVKDTTVRMRLTKGLSSATAHPGDSVECEVLDDVMVDGVLVIARGAKATGTVAEAEIKKRFGHDGKIAISVTTVQLTNHDTAPVRMYFEAFGNSNTGAPVQLSSGKDVTIAPGTDFKALVDGDVRLKREDFVSAKSSTGTPAADNSQGPQ